MVADRGKRAERLLKAELTKLATSSDTAFFRLPDARAGSFAATLCDFLLMRRGRLCLLECKSVRHAYRLPHGNFSPDQVARMRLWWLAGADAFVLIYHEVEDVWRVRPLRDFMTRTGGSWDLRLYPTMTLDQALTEVLHDTAFK